MRRFFILILIQAIEAAIINHMKGVIIRLKNRYPKAYSHLYKMRVVGPATVIVVGMLVLGLEFSAHDSRLSIDLEAESHIDELGGYSIGGYVGGVRDLDSVTPSMMDLEEYDMHLRRLMWISRNDWKVGNNIRILEQINEFTDNRNSFHPKFVYKDPNILWVAKMRSKLLFD